MYVQLPHRRWPGPNPEGLPLAAAVPDEVLDVVGLERDQDRPEELPLCLLGLGPGVGQVCQELRLLHRLLPDLGDRQLWPCRHLEEPHLAPPHEGLLHRQDLLEEHEGAAVLRGQEELLKEQKKQLEEGQIVGGGTYQDRGQVLVQVVLVPELLLELDRLLSVGPYELERLDVSLVHLSFSFKRI